MRRIQVDAQQIDRFGSTGVTIGHPTLDRKKLLQTNGPASMVLAQLNAGGVLGRHPAVGPQLLLVAAGTVQVAGGDGLWLKLSAGEAVLFDDGEQHETRAAGPATLALMQWNGVAPG